MLTVFGAASGKRSTTIVPFDVLKVATKVLEGSIVIAGGAKTLASPRNDFERDFILEQMRMSILLHKTQRTYLICHSDCATYGGLAAYKNDRAAEAEHHGQELQRARELLNDRFPELQVECFFVNFEGVFAAEAHRILRAI